MIRRRTRKWLAGVRSSRIAANSPGASSTSRGNSVSPKAVTAPVIAVPTNMARPTEKATRLRERKAPASGCADRQAARAPKAVNRRVFVRCRAITIARSGDRSSATSSPSTKPAPMAPSNTMKSSVRPTSRVTGLQPDRIHDHASSAKPNTPQSALVARWVNSIRVAVDGEVGSTSPWQVGQLLPHPSPLCEIRTQAPNRMTAIRYARNAHAASVNRDPPRCTALSLPARAAGP